jgi:DNA polymerase-3 subunit delta'
VCDSCRLLQARSHPDLYVLLPEALRVSLGWAGQGDDEPGEGGKSRRKPSRQIRIDEVRDAIDWVVQTSARGRAKVVVIHPAGAMNLQAASALLKTLEEPPGQARLLLSTVDEGSLLPTVRSRCQRIRLAAPPVDEARSWLQAQGVADAALLLAAAGGAPLAARELAAAGIDAAAWGALPRAVALGQAQALAGWPLPRAVDALQKLCHDAMRGALGGAPNYFAPAALPPGARLASLSDWAKSLARAARHDEHPWNEALLVEALVLEGRACWQEATTRPARGGKALDTLRR